MNGLLPIIRRVRRPLLPPEERAASVPLAVPVAPAVAEASKMLAASSAVSPPVPALKKKAHAPRPSQTAAAS
jgi:hypothetical protein